MSEAGRWADLGPRLVSAAVLLAVGGVEIWLGGMAFKLLVFVLAGLAAWELARLAGGPGAEAVAVGVISAAALYLASRFTGVLPAGLLLATVLICAPAIPKRRLLWLAYAPVILVGAYALIETRNAGLFFMVWLVAVVVATDIAGYVVGRLLGGPRFWPALSPRKTWSGVIGGWLAAMAAAAALIPWGATPALILVSAPLAFASQLGDIAESAVKRRAGVKDASSLIPGHGGVMDRFDALLAAALALFVAGALTGMAG